jgi:hypothetical protein
MMEERSHLSDAMLLSHIDGELASNEEKRVRAHIEECWKCRSRQAELERAIGDFVGAHHLQFEDRLPPPDGPRALLKARMSEAAAQSHHRQSDAFRAPWEWFLALAAVILLVLGVETLLRETRHRRPSSPVALFYLPDSRLTPGATVRADRAAVCSAPDMKNKSVPVELQKRVFEEYGIPGVDPGGYEVDYLVTPALGGADDIHNLWPHSFNAEWNAKVKDELEDRLRDLVCGGRLDLPTAQREIATDWVAAYKKYFGAEKPLDHYCRRCRP